MTSTLPVLPMAPTCLSRAKLAFLDISFAVYSDMLIAIVKKAGASIVIVESHTHVSGYAKSLKDIVGTKTHNAEATNNKQGARIREAS